MPKLIEIRKLAAVDMAWLGPRVIVAEYFVGMVLPLALGIITLRATLSSPHPFTSQTIFGIWLVTIAANYVPLFLYAMSIAKSRTVQTEGQPERKHARRYGVQQVVILVPFLVVVIAAYQELRRHNVE
jgi:hypothetical protein